MFYWYSLQFILNPAYINFALLDNFNGFLASFIRKDDFLHLYNYEKWDEAKMKKFLSKNITGKMIYLTEKSMENGRWSDSIQ